MASPGTCFEMKNSRAPQTKKIRVSRNGISIQLISMSTLRVLPWLRSASSPWR